MTKKQRAAAAIEALKLRYPDAACSLAYREPYELLFATRLSAQCTDARVNIVTKTLFQKYPTLRSFAEADYDELEVLVRPCGLGKTKARDIIASAQKLILDFDGVVPDTIEELTSLPGIGRKTANLILGDIFHKPAVVTDTHCIRISNRLGLVDSQNPQIVERQLRAILPPEESSDFCHRLVHFGRDCCKAQSPLCHACELYDLCKTKGKAKKTPVKKASVQKKASSNQ